MIQVSEFQLVDIQPDGYDTGETLGARPAIHMAPTGTSFKIASRLTASAWTKSISTYPRAHTLLLGAAGSCQHQIIRSNTTLGRDGLTISSFPQSTIPKRTDDIDVHSIVESTNQDNQLLDELLRLDRDELTVLLAHIANEASITTSMLKMARSELPSFSLATWAKFAKEFGLPAKPSSLQLEPFKTPRYRLPLTLQVSMFENAWRWHDVYGEKFEHTKEATKVNILEPVCQ
jgi:hypothetical protein